MTTIGSDPEFFVKNKNGILNAIPIIKHSVHNRKKINGYEFYYDNVLAEFTIKPASNAEEFENNIEEGFNIYSNILNPYNLSTYTAYKFEKKQLRSIESKLAGCNPDNCVYEMEMKTPEGTVLENGNWIFKDNIRCAGGHVHIGNQMLTGENALICVRFCDLFLGIASVVLDKSEGSLLRKNLYGRPGRYRYTSYGVEYRTLSNFWLTNRKLIRLVFFLTNSICDIIENSNYKKIMDINKHALENKDLRNIITTKYDQAKLFQCIAKNDVDLAKEFIQLLKSYFPTEINEILKIENLTCDFEIFS